LARLSVDTIRADKHLVGTAFVRIAMLYGLLAAESLLPAATIHFVPLPGETGNGSLFDNLNCAGCASANDRPSGPFLFPFITIANRIPDRPATGVPLRPSGLWGLMVPTAPAHPTSSTVLADALFETGLGTGDAPLYHRLEFDPAVNSTPLASLRVAGTVPEPGTLALMLATAVAGILPAVRYLTGKRPRSSRSAGDG
jgi:hypothetical protein